MLTADHLLQALHAAGVAGRNVVYVSVPITSGQREIALMDELGVRSLGVTRTTHGAAWLSRVKEPNEADAMRWSTAVRHAPWASGSVVLDPSRIEVKGWEQDDYNAFWIRLMAQHVSVVVASPGWQFSRGARAEIGFALHLASRGVVVVDVCGDGLDAESLLTAAASARDRLLSNGWSCEQADAYLPPLGVGEPDLAVSAQSQVFQWLIAERERQVREFGTALDSERLIADSLANGGWWASQLNRYLERARQVGLHDEAGRLELAKFAATALGALESSVRLFGPIPARDGAGDG